MKGFKSISRAEGPERQRHGLDRALCLARQNRARLTVLGVTDPVTMDWDLERSCGGRLTEALAAPPYSATDMHLLRKYPCPGWIDRPESLIDGPGRFISTPAEDVLRVTARTVLAMKHSGFASPVTLP